MTAEARFLAKVSPEPMSGCWLWVGKANPVTRYGVATLNSKPVSAHRAAWALFRGPIPQSMCVLHRCDTRPCVNPDHLFLGTNADNIRDMFKKGRGAPQVHPERYRGPRPGARGHRKPPIPCIRCGRVRPRRQLALGRCCACAQYFRKHGHERPIELLEKHGAPFTPHKERT